MQTLRYHQLIGKRVVSADGQIVGRVADLTAERSGDALVVTALLVGPTAFLRRLGLGRWLPFVERRPCRVPWRAIERIDDRIRLRVPRAALAAMQPARSDQRAAESG
jgi:sporulation protein YlmC with PRC-barrel domain